MVDGSSRPQVAGRSNRGPRLRSDNISPRPPRFLPIWVELHGVGNANVGFPNPHRRRPADEPRADNVVSSGLALAYRRCRRKSTCSSRAARTMPLFIFRGWTPRFDRAGVHRTWGGRTRKLSRVPRWNTASSAGDPPKSMSGVACPGRCAPRSGMSSAGSRFYCRSPAPHRLQQLADRTGAHAQALVQPGGEGQSPGSQVGSSRPAGGNDLQGVCTAHLATARTRADIRGQLGHMRTDQRKLLDRRRRAPVPRFDLGADGSVAQAG